MRKSCFFFISRSTFNGSACRFRYTQTHTHIFSTTYIVLKSDFFLLPLAAIAAVVVLIFFIHKFMNHVFFIVLVLSYIVAAGAGAVIVCCSFIYFIILIRCCANNGISWHHAPAQSSSGSNSGIRHKTNRFYTLVDCSKLQMQINVLLLSCFSIIFIFHSHSFGKITHRNSERNLSERPKENGANDVKLVGWHINLFYL